MDELVAWLRAQVDEDERVAKAAVRWSEGASEWAAEGEPDWAHIARHDPARVLAEVAAKRRIIDECESVLTAPVIMRPPPPTMGGDPAALAEGLARGTLRLLASVYAGRPGWRSEWAPDEEATP